MNDRAPSRDDETDATVAHAPDDGPDAASDDADRPGLERGDAGDDPTCGAGPPDAPGDGGTDEVTPQAVVEAILFAADQPVSARKIAEILEVGDGNDVRKHVAALNERYAACGASFRIEAIARGYQMLTLGVFDRWIRRLNKTRKETRLSQAALETLAVIAYRQPVMRADIEAVRGVAVGDMLSRLRDAKLIKIVGRAEEVGRPLLYGTTNRFLEIFGLSSLKDLPRVEELVRPGGARIAAGAADVSGDKTPTAGNEPAVDEPDDEEPDDGERVDDESVDDESVDDEPVTGGPPTGGPTSDEPLTDEPVTDESAGR